MRFRGVYSVSLKNESLMSEGFESLFLKNPFHFAPVLKHLFSSLLANILKRSQVFVLEIAFVQSCPVFSPLSCFFAQLCCVWTCSLGCVHIVGFNVKFWWVKLCISPPVLPFIFTMWRNQQKVAVTKHINKSQNGSFIISLTGFIVVDI